MSIENLLSQRKDALVNRWFDLVLETYPPETARMLRKESNQFANPVGHTMYHGLQGLIAELTQPMDPEKVRNHLDRIIRIRAVQDFSPAQAVVIVFMLKKVVRESTGDDLREKRVTLDELLAFESKIDDVALLGFNIYMGCREKLYDIRVNELKNRTFRLLQRANLLSEVPELDPDAKGRNTNQ